MVMVGVVVFVEYMFVLDYICKKGKVNRLEEDKINYYGGDLCVFVMFVKLCFCVGKL